MLALYCCLMAYVATSFAITVDYFPSKCNGIASVTTSHQLDSSLGLTYSNNITCTYTVTVPDGFRVLVTFPRFDLETKVNNTCVDYVNLYDGESTSEPLLNSEPLCGTVSPGIFNSSQSSVTLQMVTDDTGASYGFGAIFTAVYEGPCNGDDFSCNNTFCISRSLECNGLNQCGDRSDEESCSTQDLLMRYGKDHAPMIAGIVLGLVVGGIIATIVGMYVYKRNKWQRFLNETDAEDDAIWEIESAYPVTQRYFKGNRAKPTNYNTLNEPGETQPAMSDDLPRDIDVTAEINTSNTNV